MIHTKSKYEELEIESSLNIIQVAASTNARLSRGESVEDCFADLERVCTPLLILHEWKRIPEYMMPVDENKLTEYQTKKAEEARNKRQESTVEQNEQDDYENDFDADIKQPGFGDGSDEKSVMSASEYRFIEIMSKDPETVTSAEKRDAFRLLPYVINHIVFRKWQHGSCRNH